MMFYALALNKLEIPALVELPSSKGRFVILGSLFQGDKCFGEKLSMRWNVKQ